ncbi:MAG: LUD domain-containing protein [Acidobacteriaceae bacterium]|nr:LUD domain-containing protein [Acidobacteriaceae bacterium]
MSAREEILEQISRGVGERGPNRASEYASIPREYKVRGTSDPAARVELFLDRLHDYGATVYRCTNAEIAATITRALSLRNKQAIFVAPAFPRRNLPAGFTLLDGASASYSELDQSAGVLTTCAIAIAVTGTIVLRHSAEEGRRALTLIPDYHLCVVYENQVVETVPEGIRAMSHFGTAPLTTISGPSATADIEMTRVKGVHGPRTLDVILAAGSL